MKNNIEILKDKYLKLKQMNKENRRFYHFKSVRNFIIHFHEIATPHDREIIFNLLNGYLDEVIENDILDIYECQEVFTNYIKPVGKYFTEKLKFVVFFKWYTILFYILSFYAILTFFSANSFFFISGFGVILFFMLEMFIKIYQKRIYSFSW